MAAYAPTARYTDRRKHPRALLIILAGHAAALGAVMTMKMDLPVPFRSAPTEVDLIDLPKPPEPEPQPRQEAKPQESIIDKPVTIVPAPPLDRPQIDVSPIPRPIPDPGTPIGPIVDLAPQPLPQPMPRADPVRVGPRFATPQSRIKPPYPTSKLRTEEEAALRLKLSIDERGRVWAVEPVGKTDRAFLEAARRHLIANWRYQPATEDGRPVASSTVITLRFELTD